MTKVEKSPDDGIFSLPSFPIILVTVEKNIMTAAAFHFYSFKPPCVMVGILPKNLTYQLISEKGEFGINIPSKEQLEIVQICGEVSGRDEDKFEKTNLTPQHGKVIESYLIEECPFSLECKVVHEVAYGGSHKWFIGEVKTAHIDENYTRDKALMYWIKEYRKVGDLIPTKDEK